MDSTLSRSGRPAASDFLTAIYLAFIFVVTRFFLDRFIYRRLAIWLLSKGGVPLKKNDATLGKIVKCSESLWKFTYYATVETCILAIAYDESWFRDTKQYFRGWPNQELNCFLEIAYQSHAWEEILDLTEGMLLSIVLTILLGIDFRLPLKLYYMCQCGFYIYSIAALLTWETRRKDFSVMMSHHVVTVVLIGYSYISRFFRIGSVILALHDASDVFMEAAKVFKYSEKELAASVFFGCFAISWLVLRLIVFPFWVIHVASYDIRDYMNLSEAYPMLLYYVFNTMLLTLLVFHIYWWILICSMIRRQLNNSGHVGEDIRSDSEEDE